MNCLARYCLLIAGLLAGALQASPSADNLPAAFKESLRRALDADATWEMEKKVPALKRPLKSTGRVSCYVGTGFIWQTDKPRLHTLRITPEGMTFSTATNEEVRPADDLPYYAHICALTDAFARGDEEDFVELFDTIESIEAPDGTWQVHLMPNRRMRRLFTEFHLAGGETLDSARFITPDETEVTITFHEIGRKTHQLWATATPTP